MLFFGFKLFFVCFETGLGRGAARSGHWTERSEGSGWSDSVTAEGPTPSEASG